MRVGFTIQNTERYRSWRTLWRWRTREPVQSVLFPLPETPGWMTLHVEFSVVGGVVYIQEQWLKEGPRGC